MMADLFFIEVLRRSLLSDLRSCLVVHVEEVVFVSVGSVEAVGSLLLVLLFLLLLFLLALGLVGVEVDVLVFLPVDVVELEVFLIVGQVTIHVELVRRQVVELEIFTDVLVVDELIFLALHLLLARASHSYFLLRLSRLLRNLHLCFDLLGLSEGEFSHLLSVFLFLLADELLFFFKPEAFLFCLLFFFVLFDLELPDNIFSLPLLFIEFLTIFFELILRLKQYVFDDSRDYLGLREDVLREIFELSASFLAVRVGCSDEMLRTLSEVLLQALEDAQSFSYDLNADDGVLHLMNYFVEIDKSDAVKCVCKIEADLDTVRETDHQVGEDLLRSFEILLKEVSLRQVQLGLQVSRLHLLQDEFVLRNCNIELAEIAVQVPHVDKWLMHLFVSCRNNPEDLKGFWHLVSVGQEVTDTEGCVAVGTVVV